VLGKYASSVGKTITSIVVLLAAGIIGSLLGQSAAHDVSEADRVRTAARSQAFVDAMRISLPQGRTKGFKVGLAYGRKTAEKVASAQGKDAGSDSANAEIEAAAQAAVQLEYVDELPNGEPGYVLPEDERTLGCVGYDADTGECVGD